MEDENTNLSSKGKRPVTKEKLRSIMEAASALTALGDEESENSNSNKDAAASDDAAASLNASDGLKADSKKDEKDESKRYLPDHKKPDAAPTFPEKLMKLMRYAEEQGDNFCVSWLDDGKSFVINNPDDFTRFVVPKYFKPTKFSSFTRKLYRWGFRQVNRGIGPDDPIIFGNEYFQRDHAELMAKMRSITAAGSRKSDPQTRASATTYALKRPLEETYQDNDRKRMLLDQFLQQKAGMMQGQFYPGMVQSNGPLSLTCALRPSLGMGSVTAGHSLLGMNNTMNGNNIKAYDLLSHQASSGVSLMNQYMPQSFNNSQQYPNTSSTAEIVNAAINALRYAN